MTSYSTFSTSSKSRNEAPQGNLHHFVGSPDQVNSTEDALGSQFLHNEHDEDSTPTPRRTRPIYGRSISTFVPSSDRNEDLSRTGPGMASSYHAASHDRHQLEREWSVFGQLMDRDDQYGRPPRTPSTIRPRRVMPLNVADFFEGHSTRTPSAQTSAMPSVAQTPVSTEPPAGPFTTTPEPVDFLEHDEYSDSDSENLDGGESEDPPTNSQRSLWTRLRTFTLPTLYCNILKCSVAYFLGSLFTFSPYLSGFIADLTNYGSGERIPSPSGHMVATM